MRREYVVGVHHDHLRVGREVTAPRVILLAVTDHEAAAVDVHIHRGLVVLPGRVIDGGWGGAVPSGNRDGGGATDDLGVADSGFRCGVDDRGE
jgi:hypothetical protein